MEGQDEFPLAEQGHSRPAGLHSIFVLLLKGWAVLWRYRWREVRECGARSKGGMTCSSGTLRRQKQPDTGSQHLLHLGTELST